MSIRYQHLIPATAVLLLAIIVAWISFTHEAQEAFLFPRMISIAMLVLAVWNFIRATIGIAKVGTGFSTDLLETIAPGVAVMIVFTFFLAKLLGFYIASLITFVTIFSIYDPASHANPKTWVKRIGTAVIFMAIMYGLFNLLLKVQTPRGMFF